MNRRYWIKLAGASAIGGQIYKYVNAQPHIMNTRPIPFTQEKLPVIGVGTWQTFDVGSTSGERNPLEQCCEHFLKPEGVLLILLQCMGAPKL